MKCLQSNIKCAFVNDKLIFIQEYTKPDVVKCKNNHLLCGVQGDHNEWHFRHICSEDICNPVSEWHLEWQRNFEKTEVRFNKILDQFENRRADIVEGDYIVEVQHSSISKDEVDNRNKDYSLHGKEVIWVIDATKCIVNDKILTIDTKWKCESFLSCNFIYININDLIYKVSPKSIKSLTVRIWSILKSDFIESIKNNTVHELPTERLQSKLYIKQQGAGNGKTWGIIHMLARTDFQHYTKFIYVTKQHSARIIIKEELRKQKDELGFTNISDIQESNKKFIIHYTNANGKDCSLVIATIDSFMYAVGNKEVVAFDLFQGITDSIVNGHLELKDSRGTINYAGLQPKLNAETLYIVDETQDLNSNYAYAILKIMEKTNIDVFIVGDKLQSISNEINAFGTFRNANNILEGDENVCRRFIHPHLVSFVNHMVPFKKHELPEVTPYISCDLSEDVVFPILMNTSPYIKDDELEDGVLKLMYEYEKEVNLHNYYPEHFLIVTPFVKNNPFVDTLSLAINNFWIEKFKDETYKNTISDPFWKHEKEYYRYSIFHKSETGTSINLDESARSTRIVSIHASKGDGRECVFVIGVTDHALKLFSGIKDTLRYDSLLHVAITRMKKSLYICHGNDEIGRNITAWLTKMNKPFEVNQIKISEKIKVKTIIELCGNEFNSLIDLNYTDPSDETIIIDMSHHNIRGYILHERVAELLQDEMGVLHKQQIKVIKKKICNSPLIDCREWNGLSGYNRMVSFANGFLNKSDDWIQEDCIPLLRINEGIYLKYYGIIRQVIERVKLNCKSTHSLCPLELIVFHYMKQIRRRGLKTPITMIDLYNIIDIYENAYKHHHLGHDHCCCKSIFKNKENKNDLSDYLQFHYEKMKKIDKVVESLICKHPHTEWNTDHDLTYEDHRFKLKSSVSYIGYNESETILCYLTPTLNTLNFNLFKTNAMVDAFLIKNQRENLNHEKYTLKKIVVYILATNMTEPYELNIELDDSLVKPIIKKAMCEHYKTLNQEVYYFYLYAKTKYANFVKTFITDWMTLKKTTNSECPSYIDDFMSGLNKKKRGKNVEVFLKELDETFSTKLNLELEMSVSDFLEIE